MPLAACGVRAMYVQDGVRGVKKCVGVGAGKEGARVSALHHAARVPLHA